MNLHKRSDFQAIMNYEPCDHKPLWYFGTWPDSPARLRRKYGKQLRMMGGVDKHVIPLGEQAIREHLEPLRVVTDEGGFIPFPDHRIPPESLLAQFKTYVQVFDQVFNSR